MSIMISTKSQMFTPMPLQRNKTAKISPKFISLLFNKNSQFGHEEGGGGRWPTVVDRRRHLAGLAVGHEEERRGGLLAAVGAAAAAAGVGARPPAHRHVAGGVAARVVQAAAAARFEAVALLRRDRVAPAKQIIASRLIRFNVW